jgi:hypothetical protein
MLNLPNEKPLYEHFFPFLWEQSQQEYCSFSERPKDEAKNYNASLIDKVKL